MALSSRLGQPPIASEPSSSGHLDEWWDICGTKRLILGVNEAYRNAYDGAKSVSTRRGDISGRSYCMTRGEHESTPPQRRSLSSMQNQLHKLLSSTPSGHSSRNRKRRKRETTLGIYAAHIGLVKFSPIGPFHCGIIWARDPTKAINTATPCLVE
ncbi:hypothetical protein PT974_10127 [Cladobotryum mycophilum]|uniref:Uncharacterized protein n=1 Tax=Cladobotryum mycophilum TaxID=491253 RepID=A0ABR0SAF8_9HYPO